MQGAFFVFKAFFSAKLKRRHAARHVAIAAFLQYCPLHRCCAPRPLPLPETNMVRMPPCSPINRGLRTGNKLRNEPKASPASECRIAIPIAAGCALSKNYETNPRLALETTELFALNSRSV